MPRPTTLPPVWAALATHAGGVVSLAKVFQVSRRTLERWGAGTQVPGELTRGAINAWARRRGFEVPFPESFPELREATPRIGS